MRCDFQGSEAKHDVEPHYYPNSLNPSAPKPSPVYNWQPVQINGVCGRIATSKHESKPEEDFVQVRELYLRVMTEQERNRLHHNIAVCLKWARKDVQTRFLISCYKVDPGYARGIINEMGGGIDISSIESSAKLAPIIVDRANSYTTVIDR